MPNTWPFPWGNRTYVMGVLNVTPDSFSGDGIISSREAPDAKARDIAQAGADLVDVGGESTRPGFEPVTAEEELRRIFPAIEVVARCVGVPTSIDTRKAVVAHRALKAGVSVVNDISGLKDPEMAPVVSASGAGLIVVHNERVPEREDVMVAIIRGLDEITEKALSAGVEGENIAVDPGLGFGKNWSQNLEIMQRLQELRSLGFPIVIGPSRKATISRVLSVPQHERLEGTAALVTIGIAAGADVLRVHDVHFMHEVARMTDALAR